MKNEQPKLTSQNSEFWKKHFYHYDFFQNNLEWYKQTIQFHTKQIKDCKNILDTGSGSGNLTKALINEGHIVTAVDNEPFALEQLKNKIGENNNLTIILGDVCSMNFRENSFDGATSMFLLPFIAKPDNYFKNIYKTIKSNGIFSISGWSPEPDIYQFLNNKIKEELTKKGILPKHQKEWDEFLNTSAVNAKNILISVLNKEKVKSILLKTGFNNINEYSDIAYEKYAYFITAEKS